MKCPECDAEMDHHSESGVDSMGREQTAVWERCPDCGTIVDDEGSVMTPEDQEKAIEMAKEAVRESLRETYE